MASLGAVELAIGKPPLEQQGSCGLAVVLSGGRRIEVHRDFAVHTFERLVGVLERGALVCAWASARCGFDGSR